jgi:ribonucleotide monophosphatase NagD (HAD superfamily)
MDPRTGWVYDEGEYAKMTNAEQGELVTITGKPEQIDMISHAVKEQHRRRNKAARKARRKNR